MTRRNLLILGAVGVGLTFLLFTCAGGAAILFIPGFRDGAQAAIKTLTRKSAEPTEPAEKVWTTEEVRVHRPAEEVLIRGTIRTWVVQRSGKWLNFEMRDRSNFLICRVEYGTELANDLLKLAQTQQAVELRVRYDSVGSVPFLITDVKRR